MVEVKRVEADVTFTAAAKDFIDQHRVHWGRRASARNWREVAKILGLDYAKGAVSTSEEQPGRPRWSNKLIGTIDGHDIIVIQEACGGVPGLASRHDERATPEGARWRRRSPACSAGAYVTARR